MTDFTAQGFIVRPQGHGEERPSTRSEKQHRSVTNNAWSSWCSSPTYTPMWCIYLQLKIYILCVVGTHSFSPLFLRELLLSTHSSPGEMSCLTFRSTASNKAQNKPWLSKAGVSTGCKSLQTASNRCAKASLSSEDEKLACRVKRGRFREELDIAITFKQIKTNTCKRRKVVFAVHWFYLRFWPFIGCIYGMTML